MLADVTAMQLYCVQIARLEAADKLAPVGAGRGWVQPPGGQPMFASHADIHSSTGP